MPEPKPDPNEVTFCTVCNRVMLRYGVDAEGRCEDCVNVEPVTAAESREIDDGDGGSEN